MKVSIGIPFYNPGESFRACIASVLAQSFTDFELILLNDGSTDNSLAIAQSFNDPRIKIISDGKNFGLPARLNQLIECSQGEYIARMDADDLISTKKIELQINHLDQNSNVDLVSTGLCTITDDYSVIGYRLPRQKATANISFEQAIFGKADIAHATIMARNSWYQRNKYNEKAKLMEDYQLWIDAALKKDLNVGYIHSPLYFYREESSVSSHKAINAYINQFKIVVSQYFSELSVLQKIKFSLLSFSKIAFVYLLNIFKKSNTLLVLRNKNTQQNQTILSNLQQELNKLRHLNE